MKTEWNYRYNALLILALFFTACKKEPVNGLTGSWVYTYNSPYGLQVTTLEITEPGKYMIGTELYQLSQRTVLVMCPEPGTYSSKASGITLRSEGNNFNWAHKGHVNEGAFTVWGIFDKKKLTFIRK